MFRSLTTTTHGRLRLLPPLPLHRVTEHNTTAAAAAASSRAHRTLPSSSPLLPHHRSYHHHHHRLYNNNDNNNNDDNDDNNNNANEEEFGREQDEYERMMRQFSPEDIAFIMRQESHGSNGSGIDDIDDDDGFVFPAGTYFITTPIYYVNGAPHIGHLYTSVLSDFLARWNAFMKRPVNGGMKYMQRNSSSSRVLRPIGLTFSTGTDEHGSKVARQASAAGMPPLQFCDAMADKFESMAQQYGLCHTDFVRTSSDMHRLTVEYVWQQMEARGDIYRGTYEGWYCEADEAFATDVVKLADGRMVTADLHRPVEHVTESNYKFRLSKYVPQIYKWLQENPSAIVPQQRYNEVMSMVRAKMERMKTMSAEQIEREEDLSISRPSERVSWGIPVPGDDSQTIYVWLDALVNYLTVSEYYTTREESPECGMFPIVWPPDVQVIGKDILKFHALYWPAFLQSLSLPLPRRLLVHSYWTVEGVKMSKSLGNVVDPSEICNRFGDVDNVRYFLLREGHLVNDSNFSEELVLTRCNELADIMGNLLTRCFSERLHPTPGEPITLFGELQPQDTLLKTQINDLYTRVSIALDTQYDTREAMEHCLDILRKCNVWFDSQKPWLLAKDASNLYRLSTIKYLVAECLRVVGLAMWPAMPTKMEQMLRYLGCTEEDGDFTFEKMFVGARSGDVIEGMAATPPPIIFPKIQIAAPSNPQGSSKKKQNSNNNNNKKKKQHEQKHE